MTTRDNRLTPLSGGPLFGGALPLLALIVLGGLRTAALVQSAERTRWEYNAGSLWRTLTWTERSGKTSHTYFETRRNPVFVELFDPSRQYTVRLYADKLLLRGGKGSAKKFPKFTRLSGGAWKDAGTRLDWQSPAGSLRAQNDEPNDKGGSSAAWIERNFDGTHVFHEKSRTDEFVELKDSLRDYTVRLSADSLKIRGGNKTVPKRFADFTRLYTGHWAPARKSVVPKIVLDLHEAPDVARWADGAKQLCEEWYAIIYDILYPAGHPPTRTITIHFKDPIKTVAYTFAQQGEITIQRQLGEKTSRRYRHGDSRTDARRAELSRIEGREHLLDRRRSRRLCPLLRVRAGETAQDRPLENLSRRIRNGRCVSRLGRTGTRSARHRKTQRPTGDRRLHRGTISKTTPTCRSARCGRHSPQRSIANRSPTPRGPGGWIA